MSHYVHAEIDDSEVIDCVAGDSRLLISCVRATLASAALGTQMRARYDEILRLLTEDAKDAKVTTGTTEDTPDPLIVADLFGRMRSLGQEQCLAEMMRLVPGLRLP
jgi:hypothetical protein